MSAVVVGAGGLGSYIGAVLTRAGHDTDLVARGAHAEALRTDGLRVRTPEGAWTVRPGCIVSGDPIPPADVVFVAVKAYSLDEVAPAVVELARAGAVIVPLLNGVDVSERLVASGVPGNRLVDGVAYVTAFRTAPGRIERMGGHQRLVVGSSTGADADMVARVERLFAGTDVEVERAADIRAELWSKMAVVCSLAVLCGMTGSAIGRIRAHPFGRSLQERAIGEVLAVGRGVGVPISADAETRVGETLDRFPEDFYPSVLHDLRSNRRTEMDHLAGAVSRLGRRAGVETPLSDAATCAVALIEARAGDTPDAG